LTTYWSDVDRFNEIYKLPRPVKPTNPANDRLDFFKQILLEEVEEVEAIKAKTDPLERLTDLGDWLADIIVYCSTEARRHGLPIEKILDVIMQSNFSKLGADGKTIYDERGKVLKGPNYWKPEPSIQKLIEKELA